LLHTEAVTTAASGVLGLTNVCKQEEALALCMIFLFEENAAMQEW
jgi:hypothetical protein